MKMNCTHHGQHLWEELPLEGRPGTIDLLRRVAAEQAATCCPAAGDVLTFCPIHPETPSSNGNWTLRRGFPDMEDDEVAIL